MWYNVFHSLERCEWLMYRITFDNYIFTRAKQFIERYDQNYYYNICDTVAFENEALSLYNQLKELGDKRWSKKINKIADRFGFNLVRSYVRKSRG